ncbi:hypothetical protein JQ580_31365 [Bradyrhizobium japonicum]|uniref:hypothetical protein n=1 Tax=Bradyrhizobium japonicum TaxID=375 RepID=UPI001BA8941D|nr:hypothetical protein [Bradyrhizobium japonicum]MBR0995220.1 hypothetical protein [Bradyrhizobium japonicum]
MEPATMSGAADSLLLPRAEPCRWDEADDEWRSEMDWAVPKYAKKRVNWAGKMLLVDAPVFDWDAIERGDDKPNEPHWAWSQDYILALDIINNWRSSHNFPLNTFHIGLKRRAKIIDPRAITAQRIKRLASIEAKLRRFPTMTLSQMQDTQVVLSRVSQAVPAQGAWRSDRPRAA